MRQLSWQLSVLVVSAGLAIGIVTSTPLHVDAQAQSTAAARAHAELPGVRLSYIDTGGTGVPVVLMHAATGSSRVWEYQLPAFTSAGYRVIAYDRRGYGDTTVQSPAPPTHVAADDLDALTKHLRIDRFHLVGTAAGGIIATDFALSFPERVRSLVIANSIIGVQDEEYLALGRRLRPSPQFDALPPDFRELGPSYRAANPEGTKRWIELERASRPEGTTRPPATQRNKVTFALLETLTVPTLLLTGDADLYTPPPVLQPFARRIKNAESVVIDGAGHSTYWEQPELFNRAVLAFLRKH
jgi:pimeloyl-ACP methyl ester carboxylesterase